MNIKTIFIPILACVLFSCKNEQTASADQHLIQGNAATLLFDFNKAFADYHQESVARPGSALGYYGKGTSAYLKGDFGLAIRELDTCISLDASMSGAYHARAMAYYSSGQADKAIQDETKVIELAPESFIGYYMRANFCHWSGNITGAIGDLTVVTRLNPRYAQAYVLLSSYYSELRDYQSALTSMEQAIFYRTDYPAAFRMRGYYKYLLGRKEEACADFNIAKQRGDTTAAAYVKTYCK